MLRRAVSALKWTLLVVVTIAVTCAYLAVFDHFGLLRLGTLILTVGSLVVAVALIALLIRADIREEDERFKE